MSNLIEDHKRLIENEINKYPLLPRTFVKAEAYKIAVESEKSWNISKGAFSTYLTNQLKKLSRLSTQYGSDIRIPEEKQFKINKLNKLQDDLTGQFGREATALELADSSGIGIKQINTLLGSSRKSLSESSMIDFTPDFGFDDKEQNDWLNFVYFDLTPKDKLIFEHKTGFGGKTILDDKELAKKVKLDTNTLKARVKSISKRVEEGL